MARTPVDDTAGNTRVVLSALTVFLASCMIFSSVSFAEPAAQTSAEPAVAEQVVAEPAVAQEAPTEVEVALEALLKKNNKCLRCHKRDKVKTLEDGTEMSLQLHGDDYTSSAHGEVACVSCHEAIGNRRHPSSKTNITLPASGNIPWR